MEGVEKCMLRLALRAKLPKTCCSTRKARMESRSCGERKRRREEEEEAEAEGALCSEEDEEEVRDE